jgi:hypothetical protein
MLLVWLVFVNDVCHVPYFSVLTILGFSNPVCRTRDEILCGPSYKNEEKLYPDFFLSVKGHTIAIMEAKAPNRGTAGYRDDRRKLFDRMKLSVNGLLSFGANASVVGFLVSGKFTDAYFLDPFTILSH